MDFLDSCDNKLNTFRFLHYFLDKTSSLNISAWVYPDYLLNRRFVDQKVEDQIDR